ncbi:MAG: AAA family ATPase [Dictyoglomus turgidum]|uniref:AAA family ATPase n=1 Tax=Dictyoglomus turgidum TaxID=513050 RepID=UPI003C78AEB8
MIKLVSLKLSNFKQYQNARIEFPEQGKILIKGKNEAGKSTIFEAIAFALFGKPVYVGSKPNLIRFNAEKAQIELVVKTEDKILTIRRVLSKNASQNAELHIKKNDSSTPIIITGVKNVDPRIIKEIGIDQDIFINTCFIGQKRLETLENLTAQERQEIISKLFNLDYFVNLIGKAKDIKKEFTNQKEQYEIIKKAGEAKRDLPEIKKKIEEVEEQLNKIRKIELSHEIMKKEKLLKTLIEEITKLEEEIEKVRKDVALLERYKEEEKLINEIRSMEEKINILEKQKNQTLEKIQELEGKIKEEEKIKERIDFLNKGIKIKSRVEELTRILSEEKLKISKTEETIPNLLEKVENYKEIVKKINTEKILLNKLSYLEESLQKLEIRKRNLEKREEKLRNALNEINKVKENLKIHQKALDYKEKEEKVLFLEKSLSKIKNSLILSFISTLLFLLLSFLLNQLFLIPSIILITTTIFIYKNYSQINSNLSKELTITEFIKRDIPEHLIKKGKEELRKELIEIEKRSEIKKNKAERVIEAIKTQISNIDPSSLIEEKAKINKEISDINLLKDEAQRLIFDLSSRLKCDNHITAIEEKILKVQEVLEKKRREIDDREKEIEYLKKEDPIPDRELSNLISEKGSLENELRNIDHYKKELDKQKILLLNLEKNIKEEKEKIEFLSKKIPSTDNEYVKRLKEIIKDLEERKVKENYENILSQLSNKRGQKSSVEEEYKKLIEEFKSNFQEETWEIYSSIDVDPKEKEVLINQKEELIKILGEKEAILKEYEKRTGKKVEDLIPEKIEEDYKNLEKNIQKMEYAIKIAESTRESILKSILPRTMAFMQKILPILTSDRYHYAEIDESYKLRVYTSDTKDPLEKNIFSGGTQDQLSLALRLAFAMATLPQDKGVQPKFIFLDEPLGSFDEDRARGLLYLLTQGEVAEFFDQIFVVTHVPIEEELFDEIYYVNNGQIIKIDKNSNLTLDF